LVVDITNGVDLPEGSHQPNSGIYVATNDVVGD